MKLWLAHAPRDEKGRIVLGRVTGGCPACGAIKEYESEDGRAVYRAIPSDCCETQRAKRHRTPPARPTRRKDIDE